MSAPAGWRRSDRLLRDAPLAIRLVDLLDGRLVGGGLEVSACRVAPGSPPPREERGERARRLEASVNSSGAWVFPEPAVAAPDARWHVEVRDPERRFLDVRFTARVGERGLLIPEAPVGESGRGPLFSASARCAEPPVAVLRADLWDPAAPGPAAWALVEATVGAAPPVWGLADEKGRLAIFLRHPTARSAAAAPATPSGGPGSHGGGAALSVIQLHALRWEVRLRALYRRGADPGRVPDLGAVVAQPPARLWSRFADDQPLGTQTLHYGAELLIRSDDTEDPPRAVRVTTA